MQKETPTSLGNFVANLFPMLKRSLSLILFGFPAAASFPGLSSAVFSNPWDFLLHLRAFALICGSTLSFNLSKRDCQSGLAWPFDNGRESCHSAIRGYFANAGKPVLCTLNLDVPELERIEVVSRRYDACR